MIKVSIAVDRCVGLGLHLPNTAALKHITASLVESLLAGAKVFFRFWSSQSQSIRSGLTV